VRFVPVPRKADADLVIVTDRRRLARLCEVRACAGHASTIGYDGGQATIVMGDDGQPARPSGRPQRDTGWGSWPAVMAHELGHVAGLDHTNACSVMNPVADDASHCKAKQSRTDSVLCGPMPQDVERLARLYHGPGLRRGYSPFCR
jgi:hypothetical protein